MKELFGDCDGVYVGLEAEGEHKGMMTLFTVNHPPLREIAKGFDYIRSRRRNYSLYIGGGDAIDNPLDLHTLSEVLRIMDGSLFDRIAIQCIDPDRVQDYAVMFYERYHMQPIFRFKHIEWIVPLIFANYRMPEDVSNKFRSLAPMYSKILSFHGKVYIPNKVVLVAPLNTMYIAPNFEALESEYKTDRVIYKQNRS